MARTYRSNRLKEDLSMLEAQELIGLISSFIEFKTGSQTEEIFFMYYYNGVTIRGIAREFSMTDTTVNVKLSRAMHLAEIITRLYLKGD